MVLLLVVEFGDVLLIGFVGVLFMLVFYFVEGGLSCYYVYVKVMMLVELVSWYVLMVKLIDFIIVFLVG